MSRRAPLNVVVLGGDGRRLCHFRVAPRPLCAALSIALALVSAGAASSLMRRPALAVAAAAQSSPNVRPEDEARARIEPLERRLVAIQQEIAGWQAAQEILRRTLRVRQDPPAPAAAPADGTGDGSPLSSELDRILATVRAEVHNLRALEPYVTRAARALAGLPSRWPVRATVSSEFGRRSSPWTGSSEFHRGIDIAAGRGTRVVAPSPGSVAFIGRSPDYGNTVILDHGNEVRTLFGHLERAIVRVGERVERGQPIALSGNTGQSTGPHLHYEVTVRGRPVNPRPYLAE